MSRSRYFYRSHLRTCLSTCLRTVLLASTLVWLGQCSTPASDSGLSLRLIHINDTHSHFDATAAQVHDYLADQVLYTYIGGHPRLLTMAEQQRSAAQAAQLPSLFLHGGDAFKGSAYFELFEHQINIDILNRMGLDAMALGNHEFDIGLPKLAEFIAQVNFPVLAANVDVSAEAALAGLNNLRPYSLFAVDNAAMHPISSVAGAGDLPVVAVFGLALEDMPGIAPNTGAVQFEQEIASAQRTVDSLHAMGIKHIIALTHLGHQRDLSVARAVNGIDVIVGGHSHSLLGDFRHWFMGEQPNYAEIVINPDGAGRTCVVQAGQFAQALGSVDIQFDSAGRLTSCEGENTLLASRDFFLSPLRSEQYRTSPDRQPAIEDYIDSLPGTAIIDEHVDLRARLDSHYLPAVQQAYGRQIASASDTIPHVRLPGTGGSDQHGSVLAGLIADGMHYWLNQTTVQELLERPVDFTLIGAGNIRASLDAGAVHEGHIRLEILPFDTPLSVLTISGAQLNELLTGVISATLPEGAHAGKFPYNSHLRYVAEEQADGTALLTQLQLHRNGQWQDIEADQMYVLATTNYLADGNDGWDLLAQISPDQAQRVDLIIERELPVRYQPGDALPCDREGVDCKVAAQAVIEYFIADPSVIYNNREPTVTLIRTGN